MGNHIGGETPDAAFEQVRARLIQTAQSVASGDLQKVEDVDFSPAVKWKVAFLYQDRNAPKIIPIYKPEPLRRALLALKLAMSPITLREHARLAIFCVPAIVVVV